VPLSLKRALRVSAAIAGWLLFDFGFLFLTSLAVSTGFFAPSEFFDTTVAITFLGGNIVIAGVLIYFRYRRRGLWIKEEAERWLANRSEKSTAPARGWSLKARCRLLWIPSVLALLVFLFLPETMGIVSHLFSGRTFKLNTHRLRPPLTSFISSRQDLYLSALIGRGIARVGPQPYWRKEPPFSSLFFYAIHDQLRYDQFLTHDKVSLERTLPFGDEMLTCWHVFPRAGHMESRFVDIRCLASQNDITASFYGLDEDKAMFYEVLKNATEIK
jgi:hypothetical protein